MAAKILVADDDQNILAALKMLFSCEGYEVTLASQPAQVLKLFQQQSFDCVLLDLNFTLDTTSGEEGIALIAKLAQVDENIPIIVMTGWATIDLAVSAMQNGAADLIQKPWDNEQLLRTSETHIKLAQQQQKSARLNRENQILKALHSNLNPIIAESTSMQAVLTMVEQLAQSDVNVLITGENGTGKSLLAEHIHNRSNRAEHSLISVNMGAISENLFESEMFGHVKGAFTDARENRIGRFELADQGSLFLDEIGNIPLSQQSKLLRVLENQKFEKVGASKTQQVDTRVIAATNANIEEMISQQQFRQDLFFRLNTFEIQLPPLRHRLADIKPLAESFLAGFKAKYHKPELTISAEAIAAMQSYAWPGNIRELSHMLERAVILTTNNHIEPQHLGLQAGNLVHDVTADNAQQQNQQQPEWDVDKTLDELEQKIICARIKHCKGNMQNAAKSLGLSRSAFYRRIDKYQL
ncbi:sigma-54-dependent transcriptional regulator [Thalassotalea sp. ND16A]|uniref:sigma-54-dependent transcriptional regulator n=1 Tax=Thalassotalea sp. ND16A TaxID=1535422 RepID=UPI00051A7C32|nr:sigma-54 dependent transcriptional regulator [Thalassotalea sp. ND16A]KGJ88035.1 response regulator receiver protein [Thalassotalea sp. ND16A]